MGTINRKKGKESKKKYVETIQIVLSKIVNIFIQAEPTIIIVIIAINNNNKIVRLVSAKHNKIVCLGINNNNKVVLVSLMVIIIMEALVNKDSNNNKAGVVLVNLMETI